MFEHTRVGPVAQLGARLNGIQEVTGSIPVRSTNPNRFFRSGTFTESTGRSNGSDSRKRLQSGLRLGLAQGLPVAVGALVAEVGQVGVLRR